MTVTRVEVVNDVLSTFEWTIVRSMVLLGQRYRSHLFGGPPPRQAMHQKTAPR